MNTPTILITGGCSYSQVPNLDVTWPLPLQESLGVRYVAHTGHGAAGNQLISRKVISKVIEAIELGHKPEDMLVGVMWSGCCLLYTSPSPRDRQKCRMPSSA